MTNLCLFLPFIDSQLLQIISACIYPSINATFFQPYGKIANPYIFSKINKLPPLSPPPPIQHFQILLHSHRTMLDFFIFIVYIHFIHFYFQDWKYLRGMYILIDIQSVYDWLILNFWSFNFKSFKFSLCALKAKKSESFWHL